MERLEVNSIELFIGETLKLRAKAYADKDKKMIQWNTSDKAVATVKDGLVTGIGEGKAVITALAEDESEVLGGCLVTVTKRQPKRIKESARPIQEKKEVKPKEKESAQALQEKKEVVPEEKVAAQALQGKKEVVPEEKVAAQLLQEKKAVMPEKKESAQSIHEKSPDSPEEFIRIEESGCFGIYKFKKTNNRIKGVAFVELINTEKTDIIIPAAICIDGQTYPVTELAPKAFKDNQEVKSVIIGRNVKKVGREAFCDCINLKKITIKGTALKSIGKNAVKNIDKKATIKCPEEQIEKYKELFKGSTGYKKTMKIKK